MTVTMRGQVQGRGEGQPVAQHHGEVWCDVCMFHYPPLSHSLPHSFSPFLSNIPHSLSSFLSNTPHYPTLSHSLPFLPHSPPILLTIVGVVMVAISEPEICVQIVQFQVHSIALGITFPKYVLHLWECVC